MTSGDGGVGAAAPAGRRADGGAGGVGPASFDAAVTGTSLTYAADLSTVGPRPRHQAPTVHAPDADAMMPPDAVPLAGPASSDPFADLLSDVASAIESSVPPWRVRLGEAAARWQAEGIATGILERALRLAEEPDVDGLLATFADVVARLRALEQQATALGGASAGQAMFRDPARAAEAESHLERLRRDRAARPPLRVDAESWVREWPDVLGLLVGDA